MNILIPIGIWSLWIFLFYYLSFVKVPTEYEIYKLEDGNGRIGWGTRRVQYLFGFLRIEKQLGYPTDDGYLLCKSEEDACREIDQFISEQRSRKVREISCKKY